MYLLLYIHANAELPVNDYDSHYRAFSYTEVTLRLLNLTRQKPSSNREGFYINLPSLKLRQDKEKLKILR